jgi:hypothetical protein
MIENGMASLVVDHPLFLQKALTLPGRFLEEERMNGLKPVSV